MSKLFNLIHFIYINIFVQPFETDSVHPATYKLINLDQSIMDTNPTNQNWTKILKLLWEAWLKVYCYFGHIFIIIQEKTGWNPFELPGLLFNLCCGDYLQFQLACRIGSWIDLDETQQYLAVYRFITTAIYDFRDNFICKTVWSHKCSININMSKRMKHIKDFWVQEVILAIKRKTGSICRTHFF